MIPLVVVNSRLPFHHIFLHYQTSPHVALKEEPPSTKSFKKFFPLQRTYIIVLLLFTQTLLCSWPCRLNSKANFLNREKIKSIWIDSKSIGTMSVNCLTFDRDPFDSTPFDQFAQYQHFLDDQCSFRNHSLI